MRRTTICRSSRVVVFALAAATLTWRVLPAQDTTQVRQDTTQLGVDPLRRQVVVAKQDEGVEEEVGHLIDHLLGITPLAGHGSFRCLLANLAEDLVEPLGEQRGDVGLLRRVLPPLLDDVVDGIEDVGAPIDGGGVDQTLAVARYQQERTQLPQDFFRVIENGIDLTRIQLATRNPQRVWPVGISDPDQPLVVMALLEIPSHRFSVSTSSQSEQPGHIQDPRTGRPADRARSVTVVAATGLVLAALAGPAAAAPDNRHTHGFTVTCAQETFEVVIVLHSQGLPAHVGDSTSRVVGLAFRGDLYLDGEQFDSFDTVLGKGPAGRVQTCAYALAVDTPDGLFEVRDGEVDAILTPARH